MKPELIKFVAGTKAKASEVNENFEKVLNYAETASAIVSFDIETEYKYGQWVSGQVDDKFGLYESLVEKNKGHLLSDEAYWKKVYMGGGGLITGQTIFSLDPLYDNGLHLPDGALLSVGGIYDEYITKYIANLYTKCPHRFCTEEEWQTTVSTYGVCGKYVYTEGVSVRLPKATGIVEGTLDVTALGEIVEAGLPNIEGDPSGLFTSAGYGVTEPTGAFSGNEKTGNGNVTAGAASRFALFDASKSNPIYGNSDTVQPQTIKGYYYIVVATTSKTDIEVDLDNIATDLNGKADVDLTNVTDEGKALMSKMAMPSNRYIDLTLGASETTYTAPANGWIYWVKIVGSDWYYINVKVLKKGVDKYQTPADELYSAWSSDYRTSAATILIPIKKGYKYETHYNATGATVNFRFIYAEGEQ